MSHSSKELSLSLLKNAPRNVSTQSELRGLRSALAYLHINISDLGMPEMEFKLENSIIPNSRSGGRKDREEGRKKGSKKDGDLKSESCFVVSVYVSVLLQDENSARKY